MKYSKAQRRLDVSGMLVEMGHSLTEEGSQNKDYSIIQTGTFLTLIGSLLFSEKDSLLFGQLCSMFSAKKVLEQMDKDNSFKNLYDEKYDDIIKKINKLKDGENDNNLLE